MEPIYRDTLSFRLYFVCSFRQFICIKMHLSDKREVKYYNQFTDVELEMINEGIHSIGLRLLNTHLQMVKG